MTSRWLIAADDLTGAADCAIAFTQAGVPAAVVWGESLSTAPVVAVNIESRSLPAAEAAEAHLSALRRLWSPGTLLYKKIDSTLRGQPAAELGATVAFLRDRGMEAFTIISPAFPGTGRITQQGSVRIQGQPLEATTLWARDHTYDSAHLPTICAEVGLNTALADLAIIRRGPEVLGQYIDEMRRNGLAALVCDAETVADLDIIATATRPRAENLIWVGSGGLAASLARLENDARASAPTFPALGGGILVTVGSVAEASRASARQLVQSGKVRHVMVDADIILAADRSPLDAMAAALCADLKAGRDVLIEIALTEAPDLSQGKRLMDSLGAALRPVAAVIGGLIATGGDTAAALLNHFGIDGLDLIEEIESGIPLGLSIGRIRMPVVTKAGAFGNQSTLAHCLDRIHALATPA